MTSCNRTTLIADPAEICNLEGFDARTMKHLERYTPEICAKLRQMAETRDWNSWRQVNAGENLAANRAAVVEEIELTYHLHGAAEASGARAGLPPIGRCPIPVPPGQDPPDPAAFLSAYGKRNQGYFNWKRGKRAETENRCCN